MKYIYRPPPPPFIGGVGPLLPRRLPPSELAVPVNEPSITSGLRNAALLAIVVGMWQPSLLGLPQGRQLLAQGAAVADDPPFTSRTSRPTVLASWQPPPPAPQVTKKLPPSVLAVPEDDPPFTSRTSLPTIRQQWEPPDPQPWPGWKLHPSIEAVPEDDPPFSQRSARSTILTAWEPPPPAPWQGWKVHPSIEAVAVDDPPFTSRTSLPTIRESWEPPPPMPWPGWQVNPSLEAVPEDAPPVGRRLWVSTVLASWEPAPPSPQVRTLLVPPDIVPPGEEPPADLRRWLPSVLRSWEPPDPQPWLGWKVNPALEAVPEDDPPVGRRLWLSTVLDAWQPPPLHQTRRLFAPRVVGDDPPVTARTNLPTILGGWQPAAPATPLRRFVPTAPAAADQPPADPRLWVSTVLRAWQPPPPRPWLGWDVHPSIEAVPVDAPPVSRRVWLPTVLEAWHRGLQPPRVRRPIVSAAVTPPVGGTAALQQSAVAGSVTIQANTNRYHRPGSCAFFTQEALEHLARTPWATAGVWSDLWIRVTTNMRDGSSTTITRINGADGNQLVTVPALTTGFFHDAVNTDVLAPGDLIDYQTFSTHSVSATLGYNVTLLQTVFTATAAGHVYRRVASQQLNRDTGFQSLGPGSATNAAELGYQQVCTPGTFRNAAVDVIANIGGSSSSVTFRVNGADTALTLTIPAGTTGVFENLVDAVAVVQDDLVNWRTDDNATILSCRSYCVDYDTAAFHGGGTRDDAGIDLTASTCPGPDGRCDGFGPHSGWFDNIGLDFPESDQQAEALVTDSWTGIVVVVPINGQNGTTTWKGRKDGADTGFVVSVPALTTGTFTSVGPAVAVVPTSLINIRRTAGGTSPTALTYYTHNFLGLGQPGCPGDTGAARDDGAPYTPTDPAACPGPGDTGAARDDGIPYTP